MWSGIDYGGETAGWPMVTSQFGVLDRCRFPNDAYYYYLQEWTTAPMVHLFPNWTWPGKDGQTIDVWCYSNCDSVELFLNGKSLGAKPRQPLTHITWKVPYEPGTLAARAVKDGKVIVTHQLRTASAASQIRLTPDRQSLTADGRDLSFITASILDGQGEPVPAAENDISIEVAGPGRLLGLCSGDPGSHENPHASHMKVFNSLLLAIIQTSTKAGEITVRTSSPGLELGAAKLASSAPIQTSEKP